MENPFHMSLGHNFYIQRKLKCYFQQKHHVNLMAALMAARIIWLLPYMRGSFLTHISAYRASVSEIEVRPMFQKSAAISAAIK